MRFRILGPMELHAGAGTDPALSYTPSAAKLRVVLATLLVRANEVVSVESLIDELWQDGPPRTAMTTLQVYVSQLRKLLDSAGPGLGRQTLLTRNPGYLLRVAPDECDATVFDRLQEQGRKALEADDHATAADVLREALGLWRGPLLSDTPHGPVLDSASVRLAEARTAALDHRVRADLQLGRHRGLIAELRSLTAEQPLREEFHAHLMVALYRTGRQAEALRAFGRVRRTLIDELGIEPGPVLQRLQKRILDGDPALLRPRAQAAAAAAAAVATVGAPAAPAAVVAAAVTAAPGTAPAADALPAADRSFTGRTSELERMEALLRNAPAGTCVAVTGKPGTGKTALAVEAAHRCADAFPDGRFFLDLRPAAGRPLTAAEAMERLLRRAGGDPAPAGDAPTDPARLQDALRALFAGRRVLLVLDNAVSESQVRPLLPVTEGSTAVITSRRLPAGLGGIRPVVLDTLTAEDAHTLLTAAGAGGDTGTGTSRDGTAADPGAVDRIAELCGRLPLALRAATAQLAARPHWTAAALAGRLQDERGRLDALRAGDLDVRARLRAAYDDASGAERRAFRLLAVLPPWPFGPGTAAGVLGLGPEEAGALVESLVDARLLDADRGRYRFHELLRLLAAERLAAEESPSEVRAATERMCETYADAEHAGPAAAEWFAQERPALVRAVRAAYDAGLWELTVRLADTLTGHLEIHAAWEDWETTHTLALEAAGRCGDLAARARMLRSLGDLAWQHRRLVLAGELWDRARRAAEEGDDAEEYGRSLVGLAELRLDSGAVTEAAALLGPALAAVAAPAHARGRYEARRALALLALESGGPDGPGAAEAHFTACLDLATVLRDRRLEAYARRSLRTLRDPSGALEIRPGLWRLRAPA